MQPFGMQKLVHERSLWRHHIGVLLRRHALFVFLGEFGTIAALVCNRPRNGSAMRRWSIFIWLGENRCGFGGFCSGGGVAEGDAAAQERRCPWKE